MPIGKDKIFQLAKGFRGRAKNCIKIARSKSDAQSVAYMYHVFDHCRLCVTGRVEKALQHSYRGRKEKKRDWRTLWIARINAATREHQARDRLYEREEAA